MEKLNPEVKVLWTRALRSDEYPQGYMALRNSNNTYCCWGVLTDLYHKQTGKGQWVRQGFTYNFMSELREPNVTSPPVEVCVWAGVDDNDLSNESVIGTLMGMNDSHRKSFGDIADWIDENL